MYLKRLDIHGFKTFAQRTSFVFPPGITAVVGSNGTGKSNLADAVRWVLGEQSLTQLRCKRTEDLIFGGGKGRPPMGFADVSLTIDNADRLLPLPFDEVTIGRRAYRSGENEYFINRSRVRLRDIAEAVAPLGSSFTLINQGLVDAALALHAAERQRLFEDAAEIGPYQAKQSEAQRRLHETEANLLRLNDLLHEQEPGLRSLKRQARDAEAVGALESELETLLLRYYRTLTHSSQAALSAAEQGEQMCARRLDAARQGLEAATRTLSGARAALRERREALAALRENEAALDRRIAMNLREQAVADERRAGLQARLDELLHREQGMREARAAAAAELKLLQTALEQGEAALGGERALFADRVRSAGARIEARRAAEAGLTAARVAQGRAGALLGAAEARYGQQSDRAVEIEGDLERFERERSGAEAGLAAERAQLPAAEQALAQAAAGVREQEAAREACEQALRTARAAREVAGEALVVARRRLGDLEARLESLRRLMRSHEGAYPGVRAAMQWAARAGHTGMRLVSSIISVPEELETAVEVALSSRLQQIVVDRWEIAEAAIAELKRTGAGRATFLPLDSLRVSRSAHPARLARREGVLGCAAEMVQFEPRYASVVKLLLGRTFVAADLPAARAAVAELDGGSLLVTLAGEQVAATGALTGGSSRADAGLLRRERQYRELPGRIEAARAEVARLEGSAAEQDAQVAARLAAVRASEVALGEARAARERRQQALDACRRRLQRAEETLATWAQRIDRARREHAEAVRRHEHAGAEADQARAGLVMARAAAAEAEALLEERQREAHADEEALRRLREALVLAEAAQRTRAEAVERGRRAEREAEREADEMAARTAELGSELLTTRDHLARLQELGTALAGEAHHLTERLQPAEAELAETEARIEALEVAERTATAELLLHERAHAEAAVELQRRRSEHQALGARAAADGVDPSALTGQGADGSVSADEGLCERIQALRSRLRRMGPVNALAPAEYAALYERHTFLQAQLADVRAATATLRDAIRELDALMDDRFQTTFEGVACEFSAAFTRLFGGGTARLELVEDAADAQGERPARRGVEIVAQPPGKRRMQLQSLSGGERALTAAALLFAILKHRPRPFCIMDEVDAALDEANIVRFREALLELAHETQFIVVTHNRGTVEVAETLYGVSMGEDGGSHVLSLRLIQEGDEPVEKVR